MMREGVAEMDVRTLEELCTTLDEQAGVLEIMGGQMLDVDLYRNTSAALREALAEITRLRSDADLHHKTSAALRDALAEIERLRSDADLHQKTSEALRETVAEIERLRSDADLHRETSDARRDAPALRSDAEHYSKFGGLSNLPASTFWVTDWFMRALHPYNTKNKPK